MHDFKQMSKDLSRCNTNDPIIYHTNHSNNLIQPNNERLLSTSQRLSFLVYDFAYVVDACRDAKKDGKEFVGLDVDFEANKSVTKAGVADAALSRSFTPGEIKKLIEDNISILQKYDSTFKGKSLDGIYKSLDEMQGRADASGIDRSLVLEEFDDFYQTRECVYGVTRDSSNKRITIVFRGTENKLAFGSNWRSNASINHKEVEIPEVLKGKIDGDELKFHTGFHSKYDIICMRCLG